MSSLKSWRRSEVRSSGWMGMWKESLGSRAWKMEEKKVFKYEIAIMPVWDHLGLVPSQLVFGSRSQPSLIKYTQNKPPFDSCLCYTNCRVMFVFQPWYCSSLALHTLFSFIAVWLSTIYYAHTHINIITLHKAINCILEDVSTFLLVFVKLCLYTFLLIYIASCLLNITTKYNWVFHS